MQPFSGGELSGAIRPYIAKGFWGVIRCTIASTMPETLRLLREEITYSKAQREEVNILHRLQYYDRQHEFFATLSDNRNWIKAVIAHHLGLPSTDLCQIADVEDWLHESFNVCVLVTIHDWKARAQSGTRVLLRLPLPYRVGEEFRPGNSDEKIRCEAGTYAWLQENCPDIPIPRLYGFATSDGDTVRQSPIKTKAVLMRIHSSHISTGCLS